MLGKRSRGLSYPECPDSCEQPQFSNEFSQLMCFFVCLQFLFFCDCCCCNFLKSLNLGPIISTLSGLIMSTLRPQKWTAHENAAKLMEDLFFCFPPFKPLGTLQEQSNQNCVSWGGYPNKPEVSSFFWWKYHIFSIPYCPLQGKKGEMQLYFENEQCIQSWQQKHTNFEFNTSIPPVNPATWLTMLLCSIMSSSNFHRKK